MKNLASAVRLHHRIAITQTHVPMMSRQNTDCLFCGSQEVLFQVLSTTFDYLHALSSTMFIILDAYIAACLTEQNLGLVETVHLENRDPNIGSKSAVSQAKLLRRLALFAPSVCTGAICDLFDEGMALGNRWW